jgi:hypothetical protein
MKEKDEKKPDYIQYRRGMGEKQDNASMSCPTKRPEHVICVVNGNLVSIVEMRYELVDAYYK